jgi:prepilin peptidase CpaA
VPYHLAIVMALAVTSAGALADWKTGKIPDRLTLGTIVAAPIVHAAWSFGSEPTAVAVILGLVGSVLGAFAAGVLPYLLLRAGGMSGGDVKLFVAMGATGGPGFAVHAVTYAMVVALAQGLALVARHNALRSTGRNVLALFQRPLARRSAVEAGAMPTMTTMRLAPSIFLGTCIAAAILWGHSG